MPLFEGINKDRGTPFMFLAEPVDVITRNKNSAFYFVDSQNLLNRLMKETGMFSILIRGENMNNDDIMLTLENLPNDDFCNLCEYDDIHECKIRFGRFTDSRNRPKKFAILDNVPGLGKILKSIVPEYSIFIRVGPHEIPKEHGEHFTIRVQSSLSNEKLYEKIKTMSHNIFLRHTHHYGQNMIIEDTISFARSDAQPAESTTQNIQQQLDDIVQQQLAELVNKILKKLLEYAKNNNVFDVKYKLISVKHINSAITLKNALGQHLNAKKISIDTTDNQSHLYYAF